MNNEENTHNPHGSGCSLPEDAILYKNCGCGGGNHSHKPEKIATFNTDTNTLSIVLTGEL
jgi:hypothetical protein